MQAVLSVAAGDSLQIPHGPIDESVDMQKRLEMHSKYFSQILDMIPTKYYFKEEAQDTTTWSKFHRVCFQAASEHSLPSTVNRVCAEQKERCAKAIYQRSFQEGETREVRH